MALPRVRRLGESPPWGWGQTPRAQRLLESPPLVARGLTPVALVLCLALLALVLPAPASALGMASGLKDCPVDAAIVGVVDTVDVKE